LARLLVREAKMGRHTKKIIRDYRKQELLKLPRDVLIQILWPWGIPPTVKIAAYSNNRLADMICKREGLK
jgi:hypothetical protein